MRLLAMLGTALVAAFVGKGVGGFIAKTYWTDNTSSQLTIAMHRHALKVAGVVALAMLALWLVMLALAGLIAPWLQYIGWIPFVGLNCCMAVLAGTAGSLGRLLARPAQFDAIQVQIDQRRRLIELLKKLFMAVTVFIGSWTLTSAAGATLTIVVDSSRSGNADDRTAAIDYLVSTVLEATKTYRCERVMVVAAGCDVRHAHRTWLDVSATDDGLDCSKAEPEPLTGHAKFWEKLRPVVEARKAKAVTDCEQATAAKQQSRSAARAAFTESLRDAMSAPTQADCSRIVPLVDNLLQDETNRVIVVVTDAVDNPPASLKGLYVPARTHVVVILVRPNPTFASVDASLARAAEWARIPGVTVMTAEELGPDFWQSMSGRSRR